MKKLLKNIWIKLAIKLLSILLLGYMLLTFVIGIYPVHGLYMFPMIKDGDLVITQKIGKYNVGDVVSYKIGNKRYFGRIVASENDEIFINENSYLVNGMVPTEEIFYETNTSKKGYPKMLNKGQVFILNDYRTETKDSREFGPINIKDLDGKIIFQFRRRSF